MNSMVIIFLFAGIKVTFKKMSNPYGSSCYFQDPSFTIYRQKVFGNEAPQLTAVKCVRACNPTVFI